MKSCSDGHLNMKCSIRLRPAQPHRRPHFYLKRSQLRLNVRGATVGIGEHDVTAVSLTVFLLKTSVVPAKLRRRERGKMSTKRGFIQPIRPEKVQFEVVDHDFAGFLTSLGR